jgi:radical SAM protein
MNFDRSPLLVVWEVTQACDLACVHCRASVQSARDSGELTTAQGFRLLEEVKSFGNPLMVFTGGDPLKRPDLYELIGHSVALGLRTNITPSATPLLTDAAISRFQAAGISRMAISLDGPDAQVHDGFRRFGGTFDRGIAALRYAKQIGLETQVQTTVTRHNKNMLAQIAERVFEADGKMWSIFFLVAAGRALASDDLSGEEYEDVFETLYELSKFAPFDIKTTEGMHYRRYIAQHQNGRAKPGENAPRVAWRSAGVGDGKGFVFISHRGDIYPSGFLPVSGGNVLHDSLVDVYRNNPMFRDLRNPAKRMGKCGYCEYQNLCGGSRSRAYQFTGDYLGPDPRCTYQPQRGEMLYVLASA